MDSPPPWQDDPPTTSGRRRWQLLAVAATVPWLVVAALLARGGDANGAPAPQAAATHPVETSTDDAHGGANDPAGAPTPGSDEADGTPPTDVAPPGGATTPPTDPPAVAAEPLPSQRWPDPDATRGPTVTDGDAAAVATAVARAWLTERGAPDLEGPEVATTDAGYLEHVSVRRIEVLDPHLAVVTLGILLLEREEDRYTRVRAADLLVPLALSEDRAHPAGAPWWSPREVDLSPRPPQTEAEASPAVISEVTTALAEAGYRDVQVVGVDRGAGDLLVATVTAETAEGRRLDTDLWLRGTPDGPRVLGVDP